MLRKSKPVYWTWLLKLEYTDFSLLSDYFKANSLWSTEQKITFLFKPVIDHFYEFLRFLYIPQRRDKLVGQLVLKSTKLWIKSAQ